MKAIVWGTLLLALTLAMCGCAGLMAQQPTDNSVLQGRYIWHTFGQDPLGVFVTEAGWIEFDGKGSAHSCSTINAGGNVWYVDGCFHYTYSLPGAPGQPNFFIYRDSDGVLTDVGKIYAFADGRKAYLQSMDDGRMGTPRAPWIEEFEKDERR